MKVEEIKRVAVVGAGLMGHGIALNQIRNNLKMLEGFGLVTREQMGSVVPRIKASTELKEVVNNADLVIESVSENLELKQEIFRELDRLSPKRTILASNTSTLLPSKLAAVTERPGKVLIAHYFNPPHIVPLVEVVPSPETSDETATAVYDLLKAIGKTPVLVKKEAPGFIGNRLQAALLREAISIVERGIASAEEVDSVIKNGFGRRLALAGVFEIFDIAGWDLVMAGSPHLMDDIESSKEFSPMVKDMVSRGELGVKTGKGFYQWTPESAEALKKRIVQGLINLAGWSRPAAQQHDDLSPSQQEVWAMEEAYWNYLRNGDLESYMDLWHPDFIGWPRQQTKPVGKQSIRELVGPMLESIQPGSLAYTLHRHSVTMFGNIGIAFYLLTGSHKNLDGNTTTISDRLTHTWMKDGGKWRIIGGMSANHETSP